MLNSLIKKSGPMFAENSTSLKVFSLQNIALHAKEHVNAQNFYLDSNHFQFKTQFKSKLFYKFFGNTVIINLPKKKSSKTENELFLNLCSSHIKSPFKLSLRFSLVLASIDLTVCIYSVLFLPPMLVVIPGAFICL